MKQFYSDLLGLEVLKEFPDWAFLKIADGYENHTRWLVLVRETEEVPLVQRELQSQQRPQFIILHLKFL